MGTDAPLAQNFAHLLATDRMSVQHMPRFACHANPVDSISQPTVSHGLDPSHPPDIIHSTLRIATPHPPTQRGLHDARRQLCQPLGERDMAMAGETVRVNAET